LFITPHCVRIRWSAAAMLEKYWPFSRSRRGLVALVP
jgi:hypothetical protein